MAALNLWTLPCSIEFAGAEHPINADFRDVLEVISYLNSSEVDPLESRYIALALFYDDFDEIPKECYVDAFRCMAEFIALGEEDGGRPRPKLIDWDQDQGIIAAEVNRVAGTEVRNLSFLHWWTFVGYFKSIREGQLSAIVSIRDKLSRGKKLDKWEQSFYKENRSAVDFKSKFTEKDNEIINKFMGW